MWGVGPSARFSWETRKGVFGEPENVPERVLEFPARDAVQHQLNITCVAVFMAANASAHVI